MNFYTDNPHFEQGRGFKQPGCDTCDEMLEFEGDNQLESLWKCSVEDCGEVLCCNCDPLKKN